MLPLLQVFFETMIGALTYQVIGVALFLPLELVFPKARIRFADRAGGFIFLLAVAPVTAFVGTAVVALKSAFTFPTIPLHLGMGSPIIASIVMALFVDLQFYIAHRLEHKFFWRFHAVHHSIKNLSAANSFHHWTEALMGLTVVVPLLFANVQVGPTLGFLSFLFTYQQFYIHSSAKPHFGPLRFLLVDNRYHRIHHSKDPAHYDRNFGAMTPLWDWLFRTLYMPKSDEWPDVGLKEVDEPTSLRDWSTLPWRYRKLRKAPGLESRASSSPVTNV